MRVQIRATGAATAHVPVTILGQNLEMAGDTAAGLSTDRLSNGGFLGPADPQTGLAPGWMPAMSHNAGGVRFELTAGMSMSGGWSQLIHNYGRSSQVGMLQTGRWVSAGERLEVTLWARAQHRPATLRMGLRPLDLPAPAYAQQEIRVDATYWRPYTAVLPVAKDDDQAVFTCTLDGPGMVWIDQVHLRPEGAGTVRQDLVDAWRDLGMPALRFPGGCISTNYHWRCGTGPQELRATQPDPVFKWDTSYEFGTDEYLALCHDLGITPQISVNVGSGTPEEAASWLAYCREWYLGRELVPPVIYVGIGNEHWGTWELGNMTGAMYAEALRAYVPGIRAAYPETRILALGPETGETLLPQERLPWRAPVLAQAADLVDLLAVQHYVSAWNEERSLELPQALAGVRRLSDEVAALVEDCRRAGGRIRAAVTEWNLWRRAAHHDGRGFWEPQDVTHALFVAAVLNDFCRLAPGLELANHYHLLNPMGLYISRGPCVQAAPSVDVFRLYRRALPGRRVPLSIATPDLDVGDAPPLAAIDAVCLDGDEGRWLLASNRHPTQEAQLTWDGLGAAQELVSLVGAPDGSGWRPWAGNVSADEAALPPLSVAAVRLADVP